ncbi:MAG: BamA/TamA family outer membrane protein [Bryobacteraceae bacterium]
MNSVGFHSLARGKCATALRLLSSLLPVAIFASQPQDSGTLAAVMKYEGQRIASVQFEPADQPLTNAQLSRTLPLKSGSIFRERDLRHAIQNLFATGRFSDLAVDATEARDGVALRFITKRAYFVGHVVISGVKDPPNSGQLASSTKLRLGSPYVDGDKAEAVSSLTNLLRQSGFYHASVQAEVNYKPETEEANLTLDVVPGKRARFDSPVITSTPERSDRSIISATHWKRVYGLRGWQEFTDARVRRGLDNVRHLYEKRDRLGSRVSLTRLDYHDQTNTVKPSIDITAGQPLAIRATGVKISSRKLKELVPVFQERSIDPDLLVEGERNIAQYFESRGYFEAHTTYRIEQSEAGLDKRIITYQIRPGARHRFVYLGIQGNHYFPIQTIRERLYLQPAEFPRFPYGRYSDAYLREDIQAIDNLYRSNGFRNVKVTSRTADNFRGAQNHLAVFINIQEGAQWFVSGLSIEGVSANDLSSLHSMVASLAGQPFSEMNIADDRDNVLNYLYDRGYLNATFDYYVEPAEEADHVNVRYLLHEGPRKYVRDVLISGLETTRRKLVDDRIELTKDEPLSLAKNTESQRRLYDLGIFARVNTAVQNPDGEEDEKYVLYDFDEARHYSMNVAVGAQIGRIGGGVTTLDNPAGTAGFAPRFAFGISRINFLGLGETLGVQTAISTIEQRAALTYFIPHFISNDRLNFTATGLVDNSNDIRTFTAHRLEGSLQLGQRLSRAYTVQYRLVFRHVTLSDVKIEQLLVPLLSQPETVGLAEFSLIQDKRDDPTDAHHGIYTTVNIGYAPKFLGSQTEFGRGLFRNATYHQLGRDLVFARSTEFGVITRTGGRPGIPLAERIYSGGSTSIRAFPDFQAGPRDLTTGFPIGGNAMFINNTELRFPLYGENLGGVLFHDAGNVYSALGDMSFRFRQENLQDFNYMVQSVGFGLRYRTPIGPFRVDLSISPDAPRFFGLKGTEQDYLNGTAVATVQKINAFQFHISLGQAF